MANCPCANEAATCVDVAAPLLRTLGAGDCVEISLDFADGETVDFDLNIDGALTAEVIISGDADNALEARSDCLYSTDTSVTVNELRCGNCSGITHNPNLDVGCTGLRRRQCPGEDCDEDDLAQRLWAPPPIEHEWFTGYDAGGQFAPFTGGTIPANTGTNTGLLRDDGYVVSSIPSENAGGLQQGLNYAVTNDWCAPAVYDFTVHPGTLVVSFTTTNTDWYFRVYRRTWRQDPLGNIDFYTGDRSRINGANVNASDGVVSVTMPTIRERSPVLQPGDTYRYRHETVIYIDDNDANDVTIVELPTIFLSGHLYTIHRSTGTSDVSIVA